MGGTDHSNTPAADDGGQHIDGNSNPTLLEDPPVEAKQGEFDTADRACIGELRDEESLGPDDTSVWRACPDVFAEAMLIRTIAGSISQSSHQKFARERRLEVKRRPIARTAKP
ncbi:MAG: hypothetical protein Q9193_005924 [Seirophora villosa]